MLNRKYLRHTLRRPFRKRGHAHVVQQRIASFFDGQPVCLVFGRCRTRPWQLARESLDLVQPSTNTSRRGEIPGASSPARFGRRHRFDAAIWVKVAVQEVEFVASLANCAQDQAA